MNIKELAEQAGLKIEEDWGECYTGNVQLERFAELVRQDEREACAKLYEPHIDPAIVKLLRKSISKEQA